MAAPSRKTNRLHFGDLSASRFEDLSLALVYRQHQWEDIHQDRRTGADDGVDIRAITAAPDGSLRMWYVQCKRYTGFTAVDGRVAVREAIVKSTTPPDVMLLVVGCDVNLAARTVYEKAALAAGIGRALLWTASKLEVMLYTNHPDLLFSFFGVSLAGQERSRESDLRRTMDIKRKVRRVFPRGQRQSRIVIHSIDDKSYPSSEAPASGAISSWFRVEFAGHYHSGLEVSLGVENIIVDRNDGGWSTVRYGRNGIDISLRLEEVFAKSRYFALKVFIVGRIPFRNIFEVDEDGDEYYSEPHLYCRFADHGEPYKVVMRREVDGHAEFYPGACFPFEARDSR